MPAWCFPPLPLGWLPWVQLAAVGAAAWQVEWQLECCTTGWVLLIFMPNTNGLELGCVCSI